MNEQVTRTGTDFWLKISECPLQHLLIDSVFHQELVIEVDHRDVKLVLVEPLCVGWVINVSLLIGELQ